MTINFKKTSTSLLNVSNDILTPIGIKPVTMETLSGDSSLLGFQPFSNENSQFFLPKTQINIKASRSYNN